MNKSVVIACSGPSLRLVDLASTGLPIAAISSAIKAVEKPTYWIFLDRPNHHYGPDRGRRALNDPAIQKITRDKNRKCMPGVQPILFVPYNTPSDDEGRSFMDGKPKLLRTCHRSSLFAVQWLIRQGFTTLIFAGCDLKTDPWDCNASGDRMDPGNANKQNQVHIRELEILRDWTILAAINGITFLNWTPGSPIASFMPAYEPEAARCQ